MLIDSSYRVNLNMMQRPLFIAQTQIHQLKLDLMGIAIFDEFALMMTMMWPFI